MCFRALGTLGIMVPASCLLSFLRFAQSCVMGGNIDLAVHHWVVGGRRCVRGGERGQVSLPPTAEQTASFGQDLTKRTHPSRSFLAVSSWWQRARLPSFCGTMVFYSRPLELLWRTFPLPFFSARPPCPSVGPDRKEVPAASECEHAGKSVSRCHSSH